MKNTNVILNLLTAFMAVIGICAATLVCFIIIYTNINGNFSPTANNTFATQTDNHAFNSNAISDNHALINSEELTNSTETFQANIPTEDNSNQSVNTNAEQNFSNINNNQYQPTSDYVNPEIKNNFNTYNNAEHQNTADTYALNTDSKKIHHPNCNDVTKIAQENYSTSNLSISELEAQGYTTCGHCFR